MKKLIALLACLAMVLGLLAGCGSGTEVEYYDETEGAETDEEAAPAENEPPAESEIPQYEGIGIMLGGTGYETYAPDTVVAVINGTDVTWQEYYYWLSYYASYYVQLASAYGQSLSSWDAVGELSSESANDAALIELTQYTIRQYHAVLSNAEQSGVVLDEQDYEELEAAYISMADADGDGEATEEELAAFDETLAEQYVDKDFVMYLNEISMLADKLFDENFGVLGEKCPDDLAESYIEVNGILSAKHILLLTVDTSTGDSLDEDTIAQKYDTAATLQAELAEVQDDKDALIALFDEYMAEYNEDSGFAANPDGYLFSEGDMVQEFEDGVKALDPNYGLSDIVESYYGYHIIMRQPVTPDTLIGQNSNGDDITIRYAAAQEQFSAMLSAWTDSAVVTWNDGFESPDMLAIFG